MTAGIVQYDESASLSHSVCSADRETDTVRVQFARDYSDREKIEEQKLKPSGRNFINVFTEFLGWEPMK